MRRLGHETCTNVPKIGSAQATLFFTPKNKYAVCFFKYCIYCLVCIDLDYASYQLPLYHF